jgi:predicted phosphodiesterase
MSLKIQIASDIHAEFWCKKKIFNFIKPSAPILALLGDVCCTGSDDDFETYRRFVSEQLPYYQHIILVAGNHEYYYNPPTKNIKATKDNTIDACDKKIKLFCKTSPKLHYLNNSTMTLNVNKKKYMLIGSVLWSWIPKEYRSSVQDTMNDYKYIYVTDPKSLNIRNITSDDVAEFHLKNVRYIKSQISKSKKIGAKAIILTHHKPYLSKTYDPSTLDCAYESDLTDLFKPPVLAWCYGHTHVKDNTVIKGVKIISNPKGYPRQQTKFKKTFTIVI